MKVKPNQATTLGLSPKRILLLFFTLTLLAAPTPPVHGYKIGAREAQSRTTVRGKLVRKIRGGERPAAYVAVSLSIPGTEHRSAVVHTDTEGMYYIDVQPGKYILEIWGTQKQIIRSYSIEVPNGEYFDVAQITIP